MTNKEAFDKFFNYPTFKNKCLGPCRGTPCGSCSWWNRECTSLIEKHLNSFKIFISQPMKDKTEKEIMQERDRIAAKWKGKSVEIINSYFDEGTSKNPTDSLGKSISLMSEADLVVFAPGWENARGCRIEHEVAKEYGIQITYFI